MFHVISDNNNNKLRQILDKYWIKGYEILFFVR